MLLNAIIKKKDFKNLLSPILWTLLIFFVVFHWHYIACWFMFDSFEWIQMGKEVSFLSGSSTQKLSLLSSRKTTEQFNQKQMKQQINLSSGAGAVSRFGLTSLLTIFQQACPSLGLHQVGAAWHCSKTRGDFNHTKHILGKGNNLCLVHGWQKIILH